MALVPAARPAGSIPARLRAALSIGTWGKRPEARVRYGQLFLPGRAALGRQHAHVARALIERAEAVRGRRFTYLGRTVGYPGRIDWAARGLPVSWRLALNALDEVLPLGVTALLAPTAESRQAWYEVTTNLVRDWVTAPPRGDEVTRSLAALARRIPNLLYVHAFFASELRADVAMRRMLVDTIHAQASALAAGSAAAPRDATLIAAGRALFMAGRFFDGMEARRWLDLGTGILWSQLREQINDDGGHRGRNPAVHARVLADYLEVFALLRASNDELPVWGRKRLKGMADFLARLVHPDGALPHFHGAVAELTPPPQELLATAAALLHEPELAGTGELPGVWPLLVMGDTGRRAYAGLIGHARPPGPRALRRTGYYVLPGGTADVLVLDGDAPPPGGDPGVFGYELSVGGLRLIVNPCGEGAYGPAGGLEGAGNVLVMTVPSPSESPATHVSDLHWAMRDGIVYFAGVHEGWGLHHRRRVLCLPGRFWIVCDELIGAGWCTAESRVHLHPEAGVRARCDGRRLGVVVRRSTEARAALVVAGARTLRIERSGPDAGRQPARVLMGIAGRLPLVTGYAIVPRTDETVDLALEHDAFHLRASLRIGDDEYAMTAVQHDVELEQRPRRRVS